MRPNDRRGSPLVCPYRGVLSLSVSHESDEVTQAQQPMMSLAVRVRLMQPCGNDQAQLIGLHFRSLAAGNCGLKRQKVLLRYAIGLGEYLSPALLQARVARRHCQARSTSLVACWNTPISNLSRKQLRSETRPL